MSLTLASLWHAYMCQRQAMRPCHAFESRDKPMPCINQSETTLCHTSRSRKVSDVISLSSLLYIFHLFSAKFLSNSRKEVGALTPSSFHVHALHVAVFNRINIITMLKACIQRTSQVEINMQSARQVTLPYMDACSTVFILSHSASSRATCPCITREFSLSRPVFCLD